MGDTFSDGAPPAVKQSESPYARPAIDDVIREGDHPRAAGYGRQETIHDGGARIDRVLNEGVLSKIAAIEKREEPKEEPIVEAAKVEAPAAAPAPAPVVGDEAWKAEKERLETANRQLVTELEAAKKTPPVVRPTDKLLGEAYESYTQDSMSSLRRFVAASLGIEDLADKRIDDELKDLHTDLTSATLGLKADDAHQAKREAARAILLMAREKRERKAEEAQAAERAKAEVEAKQAADAATFIGNRLAAKTESFPLLHQFAERLDGMKPSALLWEVIQRETKTGKIASTLDDDAKIQAAATLVENHYQDLAERIAKARPPSTPSTAQPTSPQASSPSKDERQATQARTLTTADASVAPATPPAPKTETPKDKPPSFKNSKAHAEWALRRIPK